MAHFLDDQQVAIEQRLQEIRPYVEEAAQLERVLRVLRSARGASVTEAPSDMKPQGVRRNMRLEDRKSQVVGLVADFPGIRRKEIAEHLEITAARAGQIVNALLAEGALEDRAGSLILRAEEEENNHEGRGLE